MKFAKWVFMLAGIYGILVLVPLYFREMVIGRDYPPAITHPEYFYGFIGTALACQLLFLLIASDPRRYRLMMLPAIAEKAAFAVPVPILYMQQRVPMITFCFSLVDVMLGLLFVAAFLGTRGTRQAA